MSFNSWLITFSIKVSYDLIHSVTYCFREFDTGYKVERDSLKNRLYHNMFASFGKVILVPRVNFEAEFWESRVI